jgi:hypothetical protein
VRARPGDSPQKSANRFERFWAKVFGTEPQPGSGNQWFAKLDVADGSITWSLKWTSKDSHSISKELLREADKAIYDNGDNSIPGIAISLANGEEVIVTLRASDFLRLIQSDQARYITPTKSEQKRRLAGTPALLRDEDAA